ncbi:cation diffusion facilitator family transporter [Paenibacillus sp. P26]|nr:cation diffusion facilitator family transporter [Paenibacillus sp. P26]
MTEQRYIQSDNAAWAGIAVSIALALLKGMVGVTGNSKALIADGLRSASDAAVLYAAWKASKPAPSDTGMSLTYAGKAKPTAAVLCSVLLLVGGLEAGLSSVKTIYSGVGAPPGNPVLAVILFSLLIKEALFLYRFRGIQKTYGKTLYTAVRERRSEVCYSLIAFAGAGGAILGHYLGNTYLYYLDPAAGLVISLLVLNKGVRMVAETLQSGARLQQEDAADLLDTVQRIKGVIAVGDLRAREHGHYVNVDVKISVNPRISVQEGHDIAKTVKQTLMKRFTHITDVLVHVHPYDPGYPYKSADPEHDDIPTVLH